MKKTDFETFKVSLNLNIEIDANMRRIAEKIKLLSQLRANDSLSEVVSLLSDVDKSIESIINLNHVSDEN